MRGEMARIFDIGMSSSCATSAWTRNTDWVVDHTVTLPPGSNDATAPVGSSA